MIVPTLREIGAREIDAAMIVMEQAFDAAFGEAWSRGQCLGILSLPDVWLTLAETPDGRAIGFALNRMTGDDAELLLLAVLPSIRRQGVAGALIARSIALARRRGAGRLLLEVRASNDALMLYRAVGFGQIGRRPGYYRGADGVRHDALTLALALSPDCHTPYEGAMTSPDRIA